MFAGTVCALAHGACLPALLLVFGEMTDIFINAADNDARLNQTELTSAGCNWTWSYPGACHHDLDLGPDGALDGAAVLDRAPRPVDGAG